VLGIYKEVKRESLTGWNDEVFFLDNLKCTRDCGKRSKEHGEDHKSHNGEHCTNSVDEAV